MARQPVERELSYGPLVVGLEHHPLTATRPWRGVAASPRPFKRILFDTAENIPSPGRLDGSNQS
jgi:hypothetical protein